jgi:ELWxxDGT repeat protein
MFLRSLRKNSARPENRKKSTRRALRVESLESREMLAATMLKDINPSMPSYAANFTQVGSLVFFTANDGTHGQELWVTDGTEQGTELVLDIMPGATSSNITSLLAVGGKLYFAADDGVDGLELWVSDGSSFGTHIAADIEPGPTGSSVANLTALNATTFVFTMANAASGAELMAYDTVQETTYFLGDVAPGAMGSNPYSLAAMNGYVYFSARADATEGQELWRTDGTPNSVELVIDLNSGFGESSNPTYLTVVGNQLYFAASAQATGTELYVSDGTSGGTSLVRDIQVGSGSSSPELLTAVGDKLYFSATTTAIGREAWRTDGTSMGTENLIDMVTGPTDGDPVAFAPAADGAFVQFQSLSSIYQFEANSVNSMGVSTGVDWGVPMVVGGGYLYYSRNIGDGYELYRVDDALQGFSELILDIAPGSGSSYPTDLTYLAGRLFFNAQTTGAAEREVWTYSAGPVVSISGFPNGNQGNEGTAVNLTASFIAPGAGGPYTYAWTATKQGAGSPFATGSASTFSFTPDDNGAYVVELTVTDSINEDGTAQVTYTANNVAPSATIVGAPTTSEIDVPIELSSLVVEPAALDTLSYDWTVKLNSQVLATGSSDTFSFTPTETGLYEFTLTVEDDDHGDDLQTANVQVILTPAKATVKQLYTDLLGRPSDSGGLDYWAAQIAAGATPGAIAKAIMASDEYRGKRVQAIFQQYLGRSAEAGAVAYWTNYLQTGSELNFRASILSSAEYRGGASPDAFIQKLYHDILGRTAEPDAVNFWKRELSNDPTGASVALALLQSTESYRRLIDELYVQFLGRHVDDAGATYWTTRLQTGQITLTSLVEKIADSAEYSVT